MLVTLGVIAVLLAVVLPAVSGVRSRARQAVVLADLRTHAATFAAYSGQHRTMPAPTKRGEFTTTLVADGRAYGPYSYFDAHRAWPIAMAADWYGGGWRGGVFVTPRLRGAGFDGAQYLYPCAFLAAPEFWNARTRAGGAQFRVVRPEEVRFPSAKAVIVENGAVLVVDGRLGVGMADGSARMVAGRERVAGYHRGDGYQFASDGAVHYFDGPALLHTVDGVRGVDVR